ncbi:MAG TPA: HAMP domain-containing sensor histidine kinase [Gemmataceae bacterium]|nr:HAMP domain-containing sensor histidine kinase [Gemmataceae bacterium]
MRWRIRSQLLLPLLTLLLGVVGVSVLTAVASAGRARQQIESRLRGVGQTLSFEQGTFSLNKPVLTMMSGMSGAEFLLVSPEGEGPSTLGEGPIHLPPGETICDDWRDLHLGPPVAVHGRTYFCSGLRLPGNGQVIYIFYPESLWQDALWEAVWPSLVLGGSMGLASLVLAVGLGQRLSRRLQALERRTRLIAAGDFSPMPLPGRNDEIRDLTRSVNEMAQKLAQFQETARRTERFRLLGQVSGGLAHQLRNGLTGARLAVQLFERECAGRVDTAALDVALRQLTLLETHLKRFLDLGRQGPSRTTPCSLPALVGEAVELLRPQCKHAGIELRWKPPTGDAVVNGDAGQLGQLILNVLGNAVEAAGPGGDVVVRLESGATCVLEISDSGAGPPPEVAERLFEPFVTGKPEGVGLGLAVARQIAEAHGGRIAWRREAGRTVFRIELAAAFGQ